MLAKLKKNLVKKLLISLWIVFTTIYTLVGIYHYFKVQVYQAGVSYAIEQIIVDVQTSACSKPTQIFAGNVSVGLVDIACLQVPADQSSAGQ